MPNAQEWAAKIEALLAEAEADGHFVSFSPVAQECSCCPPSTIALEVYPRTENGYESVCVVREVRY